VGMPKCGKHISEQRGFCALEAGHKDPCDKMPRLQYQGVNTPVQRKLVPAVPAHYVKINHPENSTVTCLGWTVGARGCGAILPVKELTYIQTHWYTEPSGCTGGDYWNQGEGQFVCPKCGEKNRLYERPAVAALKPYFKNVENRHDR
jgi:hypothetical protein